MPDYTFPPAPVLIETTGEFAIGATGVLRPSGGGTAVQVYDLNDSPLINVTVGPKGAHQAFKADIPDGILDFGSVLLTAISQESLTAALSVQQAAEDAASSAAQAANDAEAAATSAADAAASAAYLAPGTTLTVLKSGSTWPARPTSRADIFVQWKGPDPSPEIVASGTGGMLDFVDTRFVTP